MRCKVTQYFCLFHPTEHRYFIRSTTSISYKTDILQNYKSAKHLAILPPMAAFFNNKMAFFYINRATQSHILQHFCSSKKWVTIPSFAIFSINIY